MQEAKFDGKYFTQILVLLYILVPSALIFIFAYPDSSIALFLIFAAMVYLATIIGLFLYFMFLPCNFLAPLFGLIVSLSLVFFYEKNLNSYFSPILMTGLSTIFYALPLALISTILFIVIKMKKSDLNSIK